jgi:hypothetical protein
MDPIGRAVAHLIQAVEQPVMHDKVWPSPRARTRSDPRRLGQVPRWWSPVESATEPDDGAAGVLVVEALGQLDPQTTAAGTHKPVTG